MARLTQYSVMKPSSGKGCEHEIALISRVVPPEIPDGCLQESAAPAERHRSRAAAIYAGTYVCGVVLGWGLVGVALAVWLP